MTVSGGATLPTAFARQRVRTLCSLIPFGFEAVSLERSFVLGRILLCWQAVLTNTSISINFKVFLSDTPTNLILSLKEKGAGHSHRVLVSYRKYVKKNIKK